MDSVLLEFFARIARERAGLQFSNEKGYLIQSRLAPVAQKHGLGSLGELATALGRTPSPALLNDTIDALTTNESSFFRDGHPFERLRQTILPQLVTAAGSTRRVRIWSAACSSGQEAYSIAILAEEMGIGDRLEILATDVSRAMVARSQAGDYSTFEVQRGLTPAQVARHFTQSGNRWQINERLRRRVEVRVFNLMESPRALGKFDLVLCRNVLLYFDAPTRSKILENIAGVLRPPGHLILGGSENMLGLTDRFVAQRSGPGFYQLREAAAGAVASA